MENTNHDKRRKRDLRERNARQKRPLKTHPPSDLFLPPSSSQPLQNIQQSSFEISLPIAKNVAGTEVEEMVFSIEWKRRDRRADESWIISIYNQIFRSTFPDGAKIFLTAFPLTLENSPYKIPLINNSFAQNPKFRDIRLRSLIFIYNQRTGGFSFSGLGEGNFNDVQTFEHTVTP